MYWLQSLSYMPTPKTAPFTVHVDSGSVYTFSSDSILMYIHVTDVKYKNGIVCHDDE